MFLNGLKESCEFVWLSCRRKIKGTIRDQIVMGVVANVVREKLLDHAALTLNTAVDLCRSSEVT